MNEKQTEKLAKKLLDEKFIHGYFCAKLKNQFPKADFSQIKITPIKKETGDYYYLVIRYDIKNLNQPIFCAGHTLEDRKNAYHALKFLHNKLSTVTPLFYSKQFKAVFYLGVQGKNFQDYIKEKPETIEQIIVLSAKWLAKLHQIEINPKKHNFNANNANMETISPGIKYSMEKLSEKAPEYINQIKKLFKKINALDKQNSNNKKYIIHGDFHPENIIIHNENPLEITIIDYTDTCVSDFTRDLGNFLLQFKYMTKRFNPDVAKNLSKIEETFLNTYFKETNTKITPEIKKRISFYAAWTALRNATFFLIKKQKETDEADKSIDYVRKYLNLAK